jgi:hypothetical protein
MTDEERKHLLELRDRAERMLEESRAYLEKIRSPEWAEQWNRESLGDQYEPATRSLTAAIANLSPTATRRCCAAMNVLREFHHRPEEAVGPLKHLLEAAAGTLRVQVNFELADYANLHRSHHEVPPMIARLALLATEEKDIRMASYVATVRLATGRMDFVLDVPEGGGWEAGADRGLVRSVAGA